MIGYSITSFFYTLMSMSVETLSYHVRTLEFITVGVQSRSIFTLKASWWLTPSFFFPLALEVELGIFHLFFGSHVFVTITT
jgi:hypothetical protein